MIKMMRLRMRKQEIRGFAIVTIMLLTVVFGGVINSEGKDPAYPDRSITLITAFPAGGSNDNSTRPIAQRLSKKWGVSIDIIAKPGGSGTAGTLEVMRSRPDGYTLLIDCPGSSSLQKAWMTELPYKVEERTFIARAVTFPTAIVVPADRPWKTLKDIEEAIRKDPANFKWTSIGTGHPEITMRLFKSALIARGVDLSKTKVVPFVGGTPAYTALAGGHTDIYSGSLASTGGFISAGKYRPIAVTTQKRVGFFPGTPTTAEQGFPTVISYYWVGFCGPQGLPENIVQVWIDGLKEIMNAPEMEPIFEKLGAVPGFIGGEDFKKEVLKEAEIAKEVTGK